MRIRKAHFSNQYILNLFNSRNRHGNFYLDINDSLTKFISRFRFLKFILLRGRYFTIVKAICMAVFMRSLPRKNCENESVQETPANQPTKTKS